MLHAGILYVCMCIYIYIHIVQCTDKPGRFGFLVFFRPSRLLRFVQDIEASKHETKPELEYEACFWDKFIGGSFSPTQIALGSSAIVKVSLWIFFWEIVWAYFVNFHCCHGSKYHGNLRVFPSSQCQK